MADSIFWRDLAKEFRALLPVRPSQIAAECEIDYSVIPPARHWRLIGEDIALRFRFDALARQAGDALDKTNLDALYVWLNVLSNSPGAMSHSDDTGRPLRVVIANPVDASANRCAMFQSQAIDTERQKRFEQAQISEAANQIQIPIQNTDRPRERKAQVEDFIASCNQISSTRIYKKHIWLAAGHRNGRQFEYWQSCDEEETNDSDRQVFGRILSTPPREFLTLLIRKGLISADSLNL